MSSLVQTVTGPVRAADLGRTLMHEHLTVGYPGFEAHTSRPGPNRVDMVTVCVERIRQLQELGYPSMLDPCPSDLGRDVELMVEVAEATGFNIICASTRRKRAVRPTGGSRASSRTSAR